MGWFQINERFWFRGSSTACVIGTNMLATQISVLKQYVATRQCFYKTVKK